MLAHAVTIPFEATALVTSLFSVVAAWDRYLEVSSTANPRTRQAYKRAVVNAAADTCSDPREWDEDDVVAYLATYPAKGQMRGQVLRALKSFYSYHAAHGGTDPTERLKVRRPRAGPAPSLSADELDAILRALEKVDPRARPTIELMYATGARIGSLVAVKPTDVHWDPPHIVFVVAKGDKPYTVPLGPRGQKAAAQLMALSDYSPKMAGGHRRDTLVGVGPQTIRNWLSRAQDATDVHLHPHLLRHVFATRLAEQGVDVRTWMQLMNHADPSQFRRYTATSDTNMIAAVSAL